MCSFANIFHVILKVFDTWVKIPPRMLKGNRVVVGGFDDCVEFRHSTNNTSIETFQGQHCMVQFHAIQNGSVLDKTTNFDWREL